MNQIESVATQVESTAEKIAVNNASQTAQLFEISTQIANNDVQLVNLATEMNAVPAKELAQDVLISYNQGNISMINNASSTHTASISALSALVSKNSASISSLQSNDSIQDKSISYNKGNISAIQNALSSTITLSNITFVGLSGIPLGTAGGLLGITTSNSAGTVRYVPWTAYTVQIASSTNPTKGTTLIDMARYMIVDKTMWVQWTYWQNGAGTGGTGTYRYPLPGGYTVDQTMFPVSNPPFISWCGTAQVYGGTYPFSRSTI